VFNPQATVAIGGMLELIFDEAVSPSDAIGQTFDLFDWPIAPTNGTFDVVTDPRHVWDLSNLYTTGEVQLVSVVPEPATLVILLISCLVPYALQCRRERSGR
jgi:hypothetical protein